MNNDNDLVQISLDDISSNAIKESIKKYTRLLIEGWNKYEEKYGMAWNHCKICIEVNDIIGRENFCVQHCPLSPQKWCRNDAYRSRLYKDNENWEKDVNDYIWWLTIEIETRDNYDNHAELQTMGIVG
jgi:hypothetical protein